MAVSQKALRNYTVTQVISTPPQLYNSIPRSEGRLRDSFKGIQFGVKEEGMVVMVKLLISCTRGFTGVPSISPTQTLRKHEQWHTPLHEIFSSRRIRHCFPAILTTLVPRYWICQPEAVWSRVRWCGHWVRDTAPARGRKRLLSPGRFLALGISLNVQSVGQMSDFFPLWIRVTWKSIPLFAEGNWCTAICIFLPQSQQKVIKLWKSFHKEIPYKFRFCNDFGD